MCTKQDQEREQGINLPVLARTLSDHHVCHGVRPLGRHVKNGSLSYQAWIACQWIALLKCSTISTNC